MTPTIQDLHNIAQGVLCATDSLSPVWQTESCAEWDVDQFSYHFQDVEYVISARVERCFRSERQQYEHFGTPCSMTVSSNIQLSISYIDVVKIVGDDYEDLDVDTRTIERQGPIIAA